jgi:hypothetical protein
MRTFLIVLRQRLSLHPRVGNLRDLLRYEGDYLDNDSGKRLPVAELTPVQWVCKASPIMENQSMLRPRIKAMEELKQSSTTRFTDFLPVLKDAVLCVAIHKNLGRKAYQELLLQRIDVSLSPQYHTQLENQFSLNRHLHDDLDAVIRACEGFDTALAAQTPNVFVSQLQAAGSQPTKQKKDEKGPGTMMAQPGAGPILCGKCLTRVGHKWPESVCNGTPPEARRLRPEQGSGKNKDKPAKTPQESKTPKGNTPSQTPRRGERAQGRDQDRDWSWDRDGQRDRERDRPRRDADWDRDRDRDYERNRSDWNSRDDRKDRGGRYSSTRRSVNLIDKDNEWRSRSRTRSRSRSPPPRREDSRDDRAERTS